MKSSLAALLILCSVLVQAGTKNSFTLMGSLHLYAAPTENSDVFTALKEGTPVYFQYAEKGWIKIDFTKELEVWVASCFLEDGAYTENVIFRTAPTVASSALNLKKNISGNKAEIIASDKSGYWKKVRLNGVFTGYLTQKELEDSLKRSEGLVPIHHTPVISTAVGTLLPLQKPVGQAKYKLVYKVNNAEYLIAYVISGKVNLKLWENWVIYISGESIWQPSIHTPFLRGENIFPAHR